MRHILLSLLLFAGGLFAQGTPSLQFTQSFTSATTGTSVNNGPTTSGGPQGSVAFRVVYYIQPGSGSVSALSVELDGSNLTGGTYTALTPASGGGSGSGSTTNPVTTSPQGQGVMCCDFYPWLQLKINTFTVSSGTPILIVKVLGYAGTSAATGQGGGGGTIDGIPFCTGFSPTNGQFLQYTTGGSPNPCYMASTTVALVLPPSNSSTSIANTQFVQQAIDESMATVPLSGITGGTYSFASLGVGVVVHLVASPLPAGAITSLGTIFSGGTGYAVGDLLTFGYDSTVQGNADAIIQVTGVSGTACGGNPCTISSLAILYGGSGYVTGNNVISVPAYAIPFTFELSGTLGSNATFIMPNGSALLASNQWIFANNTTGAFTVKVFVSSGSDTTTGSGVAIPQGTNNSAALFIFTDGSTDMWAAAPAANASSGGGGAVALLEEHTASGSAALQFTTALTSTYDDYMIEFVNVLPATNAVYLEMQCSTNGGSSYDSGSNYSGTRWRYVPSGATQASGETGASSIRITDSSDTVSSSADYGITGSLHFFSPASAVYKQIQGNLTYENSGVPSLEGITTNGAYVSTTAVNAIQFLFNSGNIASGTIRIYGLSH